MLPKVTYNACINSCGKGLQWLLAMQLLEEMPLRTARSTGGFHSHGDTPITGWFIGWKISFKWMMIGDLHHVRKHPYGKESKLENPIKLGKETTDVEEVPSGKLTLCELENHPFAWVNQL